MKVLSIVFFTCFILLQGCSGNTSVSSGCTTNADCSGSTPVCNTTSKACVACMANSDCLTGQTCTTATNACTWPSRYVFATVYSYKPGTTGWTPPTSTALPTYADTNVVGGWPFKGTSDADRICQWEYDNLIKTAALNTATPYRAGKKFKALLATTGKSLYNVYNSMAGTDTRQIVDIIGTHTFNSPAPTAPNTCEAIPSSQAPTIPIDFACYGGNALPRLKLSNPPNMTTAPFQMYWTGSPVPTTNPDTSGMQSFYSASTTESTCSNWAIAVAYPTKHTAGVSNFDSTLSSWYSYYLPSSCANNDNAIICLETNQALG